MSEKPTPEDIARWQKRLASQANNRAWTLAEQPSRTAEEDDELLHAAHAAMCFWSIVGNERNKAHATLLLAHVYATLELAEPASRYWAAAEPAFLAESVEPWEQALAHAVAANVAAARKDVLAHQEHFRKATEQVAALSNPEERAILEATLRVLPVPAP